MDIHQTSDEGAAEGRILVNETALMHRFSLNECPVCRRAAAERVLNAIKGLSADRCFHNLVIHGPSGSGKTAMVRWALDRMEEQNRRVVCIYANCWRYCTSTSLYVKIADAFGEPVSRRGRASDEVFDHIVRYMKSSKRPILLVLDEIDALIQYDNARILENIARADEERVLFGVIGISDSDAILSRLPKKTREILRFSKIEVPRYSREELFSLLKDRAELGLRPGSYDNALLDEIAQLGAMAKGSGRFAIQLLWRAARGSEDRGLASVSRDEIDTIRRDLGVDGLDLSREELTIFEMLKDGQKTSSEIYVRFWQMIPRTKRQIRNYLWAMERKRIIYIENVMIGNRPKYSIIRLREGLV